MGRMTFNIWDGGTGELSRKCDGGLKPSPHIQKGRVGAGYTLHFEIKKFKDTLKTEKGVREEVPTNATIPPVLNPILNMKN